MRSVGLRDPRTGKAPFAVVQLRRENAAQSLFNLVGFQTNLRIAEQRRIFRLIPGLQRAEFVRYGQMHRNTFLNAPRLLQPTLQLRERPDLLVAGQLAGVEGYAGNIASGLLAGWNAARLIRGREPLIPPQGTMIGGLCRYLAEAEEKHFQPMKANLGLLPRPERKRANRWDRSRMQSARAREVFDAWRREVFDL
jgi:methylenetetrahydrofolate--tRNA-(uracil-5-)-methyltransferase